MLTLLVLKLSLSSFSSLMSLSMVSNICPKHWKPFNLDAVLSWSWIETTLSRVASFASEREYTAAWTQTLASIDRVEFYQPLIGTFLELWTIDFGEFLLIAGNCCSNIPPCPHYSPLNKVLESCWRLIPPSRIAPAHIFTWRIWIEL